MATRYFDKVRSTQSMRKAGGIVEKQVVADLPSGPQRSRTNGRCNRHAVAFLKVAQSKTTNPVNSSRNNDRDFQPPRRVPRNEDTRSTDRKAVKRCNSAPQASSPMSVNSSQVPKRFSDLSRRRKPDKGALGELGQRIVTNASTASVAPLPRKALQSSQNRASELVSELLSSSVQVGEPSATVDVPCTLSPEEVAKVFTDHVPGVETFLFRQQPGMFSLEFLKSAYTLGFAAFRNTSLHEHLSTLFRLIVHYGWEKRPGASSLLREVAEAFMDCQAVQARVVERIGLQLQGVASDFRGLIVSLVGEYKHVAIKMLAAERISQLRLVDDGNPVHYENRLIADLGPRLGLDAADIRRAGLDEHAHNRFQLLDNAEKEKAVGRCRQLFDLDALLGAFEGEVSSFSAESPPNSLPHLFLDWASQRLTEKHVIFDETSCMNVEVERPFLMAVLEDLFLGQPRCDRNETYRGVLMHDLFSVAH